MDAIEVAIDTITNIPMYKVKEFVDWYKNENITPGRETEHIYYCSIYEPISRMEFETDEDLALSEKPDFYNQVSGAMNGFPNCYNELCKIISETGF